ncbi:MAG: protein translocase subunit SecF, partial [Deltaproteobacteria bacterium]
MKFREIVHSTNLDFIGMRNRAFTLSALLVLLGFFAFIMVAFGKANLSVDFTGGTNLHVKFLDKIAIGDLRNVLMDNGIHDVQIQEV